jgi:hypothetical protein
MNSAKKHNTNKDAVQAHSVLALLNSLSYKTCIASNRGAHSMNIVTRFICPPVPTRNFDWIAYEDGNEEGTVAYGATEQEAVNELQDLLTAA